MARSKKITNEQRGGKKDVALQVMVPPDVKRAVNMQAAKEDTTQRTIVLKALQALGIPVSDDDLHDRRRDR